ncbi:MAG: chemotaxis protein CheD [Vallitaleaceae bacterium]|jgi:chemotaxis protein CheD|nr:chemotaxis protein CheD [Vallitaleaceae bacterium]
MEMIKVGMADLKACKFPDALTTLGLGSCVGIVLYDPITKVSGMAHIMLPDSTKISNNSNIAKFADTAVDQLIKDMINLGANPTRFVSKIAGGAQMFSFSSKNELMRIGERNIEASKQKLADLKIPILAEETGENYGRTIEFYSETGDLRIKTIGRDIKII